jgi:hypothetical protein
MTMGMGGMTMGMGGNGIMGVDMTILFRSMAMFRSVAEFGRQSCDRSPQFMGLLAAFLEALDKEVESDRKYDKP